jgi:hypothetical protein
MLSDVNPRALASAWAPCMNSTSRSLHCPLIAATAPTPQTQTTAASLITSTSRPVQSLRQSRDKCLRWVVLPRVQYQVDVLLLAPSQVDALLRGQYRECQVGELTRAPSQVQVITQISIPNLHTKAVLQKDIFLTTGLFQTAFAMLLNARAASPGLTCLST